MGLLLFLAICYCVYRSFKGKRAKRLQAEAAAQQEQEEKEAIAAAREGRVFANHFAPAPVPAVKSKFEIAPASSEGMERVLNILLSRDIRLTPKEAPKAPLFQEYQNAAEVPRFVRHKVFDRSDPKLYSHVKDFVVIDFETANAFPDSVCQIGIAVVRDNEIVQSFGVLVKPPYEKFTNSHIHGIVWNDVKTAQTFGELWPELKPYINGQTLAAYNLPFDIGCLDALFNRYDIYDVHYAAFDILRTARTLRDLPNHKLVTVAASFGIQLDAHDAASDAKAAAAVQIHINEDEPPMSEIDYKAYTKDQLLPIALQYAGSNNQLNLLASMADFPEYIRQVGLPLTAAVKDILLAAPENNSNRKAKICRYYGEILEAQGDIDGAIDAYQIAMEYNYKVGVKQKLAKLLRDKKE